MNDLPPHINLNQFRRVSMRPTDVDHVDRMSGTFTRFEHSDRPLPSRISGLALGFPGTPPEISRVPVLHHATIDLPGIRRIGHILMNSGDKGLGGGHENTVSLTTGRDIADDIAYDMRDYATHGQRGDVDATKQWMLDQSDKWEYDPSSHLGEGHRESFQHNVDLTGGKSPGATIDSLFSQYFAARHSAGGPRNPIIMGGFWKPDSIWHNVNPDNIGVVSLPRHVIPKDVLLTSFDAHSSGTHGLSEIRAHGDLPIFGGSSYLIANRTRQDRTKRR